jgi:hypothetical protein
MLFIEKETEMQDSERKCPICKSKSKDYNDHMVCNNSQCGCVFTAWQQAEIERLCGQYNPGVEWQVFKVPAPELKPIDPYYEVPGQVRGHYPEGTYPENQPNPIEPKYNEVPGQPRRVPEDPVPPTAGLDPVPEPAVPYNPPFVPVEPFVVKKP